MKILLLAATLLGLVTFSAAPLAPSAKKSLFDGKTLEGWDGDERFWRVEDGVLIGQTTPDNPSKKNTFLIYRADSFDDFILEFDYQVEGFNSGVQYRSVDLGNYTVKGYQADFEARWHDDGKLDKFSGMFFEEKGRMFLAQRGEAVRVKTDPENPEKHVVEKLGKIGDAAELEKSIRRDGWNHYRIIASGNQFTHIINDQVMALGIDEDTPRSRKSGLIAFQLHSGPPMKIQVKNIQIQPLP